jgi:ATP-dependent DNA helicase RecQ
VTSTDFIDTCLLLDLETGENNRIHKIGAVFSGQTLEKKGNFKLTAALAELDTLADHAKYILGHNIIGHDLPILAAQASTSNC